MTRYALIDPADPQPRPVRGWYDTGEFHYPEMPPPERLVEVSDAVWDRRLEHPQSLAEDGTFLDTPVLPEPPQVVLSVLPVAWRKAMRATPAPAGGGNAMAWLTAQPLTDDQRDVLEYCVQVRRVDLTAAGMSADLVDKVLTLAASYDGSDATLGPVPQ